LLKSTLEQQEIIYSEDKTIFVPALAGTGKTATLVDYTKLHKQDRVLCLFYNQSMKLSAIGRFPERVDIFTYHGMARQECKDYNVSDIDLSKISELTGLSIKESFQLNNLLNSFFNSDLDSILKLNSPLVDYAELIWNKMINKEIDLTHDAYLKMYQLSKPDLSKYDIILIDEAQDLSAVMIDIINQQDKPTKIFVGDINQQIYAFRGTVNIFNNIKTRYKLTQSFRFGQKIADVANIILEQKKSKEKLKGFANVDSEVFSDSSFENIQKTHIFRTNTALFLKAVELIESGKEVYIIGAENIFSRLENALNLYENKPIVKDKYMETFKNFYELKGVSSIIPEFKFIVKLIESFGPSLRDYIKEFKKASYKNAEHVLVTAHKSKGLEFLYTKIENDFIPIQNASIEELNLLYVAVTRATYYLEINNDLKKYYKFN